MIYKRSLTFRLSALFAIVMVSLLSLLGFFGFSALEQHFQQLDQNELNNKVRLIQQEISHTTADELMTVLNKQIHRQCFLYTSMHSADASQKMPHQFPLIFKKIFSKLKIFQCY